MSMLLLANSDLASGQILNSSEERAEITVSRSFPSSGLLPASHEYVRYNVVVKNTGSKPITNQSLWVSFVSFGGKTHTSAAYAIPSTKPNEEQTLHLGPFKMHEAGMHSLYLGINSKSNSTLENELDIGKKPGDVFDSFVVYDPITLQVIVIALVVILIGIGILAFAVLSRRKARGKPAL
jgi:hypothetical protein